MAEKKIPYTPKPNQAKRKNYIGNRYGRLVVIEEVEPYRPPNCYPVRKFKCQCDCGNVLETVMSPLVIGRTVSCGCHQKEMNIKRSTKHGKTYHPLSQVWSGMKSRCYYQNNISYENYGGRGITICDEWVNDLASFYDWAMANGWKKGLTLDRINNDGNYEPENCRFVSRGVNARNQRTPKVNTSGFKGIQKRPYDRWSAAISYRGKKIHLGYHTTKEDAAMAYDKKAKELDAGYTLNFPE